MYMCVVGRCAVESLGCPEGVHLVMAANTEHLPTASPNPMGQELNPILETNNTMCPCLVDSRQMHLYSLPHCHASSPLWPSDPTSSLLGVSPGLGHPRLT